MSISNERKEVFEYMKETPHNTNYAILNEKLDKMVEGETGDITIYCNNEPGCEGWDLSSAAHNDSERPWYFMIKK